MITLINCKCQHEYQDKTYGYGVRVANSTAKEPSPGKVEVRCTVCKAIQTVTKDKLK